MRILFRSHRYNHHFFLRGQLYQLLQCYLAHLLLIYKTLVTPFLCALLGYMYFLYSFIAYAT
nr:MAG TPA: hypothetical protein [Caudoviricetes sp.]